MPINIERVRTAAKASFYHWLCSFLVVLPAAYLVIGIWYPHPYELLSGGLKLFLLLAGVDIVVGPLLTLILFDKKKSRKELITDMALVVLLQLSALFYGMQIVYEARPLFLVHEVDRFRVITSGDWGDVSLIETIARLDAPLRPSWLKGPVIVGIREPKNSQERLDVMLESTFGGRDYSQRPEFYIPYDARYQTKALARARPLNEFILRNPETLKGADIILKKGKTTIEEALFLPVVHKQEWIAVLTKSAHIIGFLPGDGFEPQD